MKIERTEEECAAVESLLRAILGHRYAVTGISTEEACRRAEAIVRVSGREIINLIKENTALVERVSAQRMTDET